MNVFGENLRKIRIQKGMSQDELAHLLGTSKQVISRYETNQRSPKVSVVADYAEKLGVSIESLTTAHENGYFYFFFPEKDDIVQALGSDSPAAQKLQEIKSQFKSPMIGEMVTAMQRMTLKEQKKMVDVGKALFPERFTNED